MLLKKMMFSLTSLITILALAFVVVPAEAADDFDATFSGVRVSAKSDHNAVYDDGYCRYADLRCASRWHRRRH